MEYLNRLIAGLSLVLGNPSLTRNDIDSINEVLSHLENLRDIEEALDA